MYKLRLSAVICIVLVFSTLTSPAGAVAVSLDKADKAARGWLRGNIAPLESALSRDIERTEASADIDGRVLYYITPLQGQGFIILAGDDELEPVVAFSSTGFYDDAQVSPLRDMLRQDMQDRLKTVGGKKYKTAPTKSGNPGRWQSLIDAGADDLVKGQEDVQPAGVSVISDIRVSPLLQSQWNQSEVAGSYCYNYYTPNHYVTGCVATAMSQMMRYHTWPTAGIGVHSCQIYVDGASQYWNTRGGDGAGGAYDWEQMPYVPDASLTTTQRQAIGALCYDAGLSVSMDYTASSSGASSSAASESFVDTFGYSNSVYGYNFSSGGDVGLWGMVNTNLDAQLPVILSISGPGVGHAVIADGYGYNASTLYHHLNMGWGGQDDTWYALPVIDSSYYFNAINGCVYNVYPTGTGEIVSGRVTSMAGAALETVTVKAYAGAKLIKQTTTDSKGIYALNNLPANTSCRIEASRSGYAFVDQTTSTGNSQDWNAVSGNKWGVNFAATNPMPPTAVSQSLIVHCLASASITLEALDDHLPAPPAAVTSIITSLPVHGTLSVPGVGEISNVPYILEGYGNTVMYQPCEYYGGVDSFSFKANDGGVAPTGGDSTPATVTLNVDNTLTSDFGLDGDFGNNAAIDTGYYAIRSQVLYLSGDIGGEKYLTDLAIDFTGLPPVTLNQWTIRIQQTTKSQYNDVVSDFLTTGWTQVYQTNLTVNQTGWLNFHFETPFYYDGSHNLLIDFSFDNAVTSGQTGWYLCKEIGCGCNRIITIKTSNATHSSPLTWDFWYGGGSYWGGDWLPSIKLIGDVPVEPIVGDFDYSCAVNLPDMAALAAAWGSQQGESIYNPACDISVPVDNVINILDLQVFAENWLRE